jgi:hypothetical protein
MDVIQVGVNVATTREKKPSESFPVGRPVGAVWCTILFEIVLIFDRSPSKSVSTSNQRICHAGRAYVIYFTQFESFFR